MKRDFEKRQFSFEHIFKPDRNKNNTEIVFKTTTQHVIENTLEGYNGCLMAYGQTGTGKTYTIVHELMPKSLEWLFMNKPKGILYKLKACKFLIVHSKFITKSYQIY